MLVGVSGDQTDDERCILLDGERSMVMITDEAVGSTGKGVLDETRQT